MSAFVDAHDCKIQLCNPIVPPASCASQVCTMSPRCNFKFTVCFLILESRKLHAHWAYAPSFVPCRVPSRLRSGSQRHSGHW